MYSPDALTARKRRTPFIPFRVTTADGETFLVTHPRLMMVGSRELCIGTATAEWPDVYDRVDRVPLVDIVDVADQPSTSA